MGITSRQNDVISFISTFTKEHGYSPKVREIGEGVGLKSTASVAKHLDRLELAGYIRRSPEKPRTIEIIGSGHAAKYNGVQVPLLKRISLDIELLSKDNVRDYYSFPGSSFPSDSRTFAIEAPDDSLNGDGIYAGSVVFVASSRGVDNGEIVVCIVENRALIRHIFVNDGIVTLKASNSSYEDIVLDTCRVVGVVKGYYNDVA